jgi:hypothetical protein
VTIAELLSLLAVGVSLFAILNQRRYVSSQARLNESSSDETNVKTALELRREMQMDRDATRKEYEVLEAEFATLQNELKTARTDAEMLGSKLVAIQLRVSQLDLMFNSLLKGSWMNYRALVEAKIDPPYLPPKEYITGPLSATKQYQDEGE